MNQQTFTSQKNFLVSANGEDGSRFFCAFEILDPNTSQSTGMIGSFEYSIYDPDFFNSFCTHANLDAFIENINWLDYIKEGVRDEEIKRKLKERNL